MTATTTTPADNKDCRNALSVRTRPPRPSAVSASLMFRRWTLPKVKHVPEQLTDAVVIPVVFIRSSMDRGTGSRGY
jgi:ABC-2 type transport system permease protein